MKKLILLCIVALCMPVGLLAQDDMYFIPTRELEEQTAREYGMPRDTYYIGSQRSVDEYNRRGSYYEMIDSLGSDTIRFDGVVGVYPDSTLMDEPDDFRYTRRMSRFDDYQPSSDYWLGYHDGRMQNWHSPFYYSHVWGSYYYPWYSSWYDPIYDPWYDPWYYGGYYSPWRYGWYGYYGGWYRPYYSGWYGYTPYYYITGVRHVRNSGTYNHGHVTRHGVPAGIRNRGSVSYSHGTFGGTRVRSNSGSFGGTRSGYTPRTNTNTSTYTPRPNSHSGFGGSRSGGGSFGGGSGFGGGTRSGGGGGSFGGGGHHRR